MRGRLVYVDVGQRPLRSVGAERLRDEGLNCFSPDETMISSRAAGEELEARESRSK